MNNNILNSDKKAYGLLIAFFIILTLVVFMADNAHCQSYGKWRWSDAPILQNPDASGLHCVGSAYLAGSFDNMFNPPHNSFWIHWQDKTSKEFEVMDLSWLASDLLTLSLGTAWEVKDALIPWERAGIIGGEGFSTNDLKMDLTGIIIHRVGVLIYNRVKYHTWNLNRMKG
jgi:hypothetical protein